MKARFLAAAATLISFSGAATAAGVDQQQPADTSALDVSAAAAATAAASGGDADAQAAAAAPQVSTEAEAKDWDVSFTPYLWVAGMKGHFDIPRNSGGNEIHIDKSFAELLGSLKFAFMGTLDVHHKGFVAMTDVIYVSAGMKAEPDNKAIFASAKVDAKVFVATQMLGYRVVDQGPTYVDLFVGGRVNTISTDFTLTGPLTTRRLKVSPTGVSPLVGARARVALGRTWGLGLYGDFGGFLDSSDVKWQVAAMIQHDLSKHWQMGLGYRHMGLHHSNNGADLKFAMSGPVLAFTYKF